VDIGVPEHTLGILVIYEKEYFILLLLNKSTVFSRDIIIAKHNCAYFQKRSDIFV
jgi:hypothetical protein